MSRANWRRFSLPHSWAVALEEVGQVTLGGGKGGGGVALDIGASPGGWSKFLYVR